MALATLALCGAAVHRSSARPSARPATPKPTKAVTWDQVAPVFAAKCASCHRTGGIAPFSLTNEASAHAHAQAIRLVTQLRVMPPWMPGRDSPAFQGEDRRILTSSELKLIADWARGGAKRGNGRPVKPVTLPQTAPGTTVALQPADPYRPHATGGRRRSTAHAPCCDWSRPRAQP